MTTSSKKIPKNSSDGNVVTAARSYQNELMEQAKTENLIVCLPTGSGKTYIAVMLIKEMSHQIRASIQDGGKRTVFLVKTVTLVQQQSDYIRIHTDLKVGVYYGELGVDLWDKTRWEDEFERCQVLVFTAQVFLNLVDHNYFPLRHVNLLIFDECHHATGENYYAALMNKHYDACIEQPRILGLTASISGKKIKPEKLQKTAKDLEETFRARIESGSNRMESSQHGTSARIETIACGNYADRVFKQHESVKIAFQTIQSIVVDLESYLVKKRLEHKKIEHDLSDVMLNSDYLGENIAVYNTQSIHYTAFLQSQSVTIPHLKRYFENIINVGYDLGMYGLYLAAIELRKKLKSSRRLAPITNESTRQLFDATLERLDCLVDDILKGLFEIHKDQRSVLFSPKILELFAKIVAQYQSTNDSLGRCIVFVERVYTAAILSRLLSILVEGLTPPLNTRFKIKHLTGSKAIVGDAAMTAKYQREIIKSFRTAEINVLIATAIVEEGLDIPDCNLVVRFNKPQNFSSYMQSKGRARAKQNALYVLLMDNSDYEAYVRDREEYRNYDEIESMIQIGFSVDADEENPSADDLGRLPAYRPKSGVVIDATRAAQLISEYCALLGNGQIFPPRFLFHGTSSPYTCILSMPANCPIRDDVVRVNRRKKLAKYECCLEMVKLLHERGEFNDHCLPHRYRSSIRKEIPIKDQIFQLADELFDDEEHGTSQKRFYKQTSIFPPKSVVSSNVWYLYRISLTSTSTNNELGFVVPGKLMELPKWNLYGHNEVFVTSIVYSGEIDYNQHRDELQRFCRYIFENVFDEMANEEDSILKFNIENSSFKLLPCLLKNSDQIDLDRMLSICNRLKKPVQHPSMISDNELYIAWHLSSKQFYIKMPGDIPSIRGSDPWPHKKKSPSIESYADHFEYEVPNVRIRRDLELATMKGVSKPRINYLYQSSVDSKTDNVSEEPISQPYHYPVELLYLAPLNRVDLSLIYKVPSILVRIMQLYAIEQLRKLLAENIKCYSLFHAQQILMPLDFVDCLTRNSRPSTLSLLVPRPILLPLVSLTYDHLPLTNDPTMQPLPDILFQAITRRSTDEKMDMENFEILGDCFLKLAVSMSLYHHYPLAGAGALTEEKGKQISNENLYRLTVQKKLWKYLYAKRIVFRGRDANWLPPGYTVDETKEAKVKTTDELGARRYMFQQTKRKGFADMMEAIMGALLLSSGYTVTLKFMEWLGLDVIPLDERGQIMRTPSILCPNAQVTDNTIDRIVFKFYTDELFSAVETTINYVFRNKAYLIAAFTHPSNFANRLTSCYERLEFLGDAVLDFLITRYIFVNYNENVTPSRVTDIRQDLSNNGRLAYILVACGLHTKILHSSPDLFGQISSYAGDEDLFSKDQSIEHKLGKDIGQWADTTAPKALADVFEALIGAIFLDSGNSMETVWHVVEPLLRQYIDRSIVDPNLNPVRSFVEQGGKIIKEYADESSDLKVSICCVELPNGVRIEGRGHNKVMAKSDACRKAMKQQT